jgi:hypothetical protein
MRRTGGGSASTSDQQYQKGLNARIGGALIDGRLDDALQLLKDFKESG